MFKRNEDCYQKTLCPDEWNAAFGCLQAKSREECMNLISLSRECKDLLFSRFITPTFRQYLESVGKAYMDCEESKLRHLNCVSLLGEYDQECMDREIIFKNCYYGRIVPRDLWRDWKLCEKEHGPKSTIECIPELDSIRIAMGKRADQLCNDISLDKSTVNSFGGPNRALDIATKIVYASHSNNIFKDYDPRKEIFRKEK